MKDPLLDRLLSAPRGTHERDALWREYVDRMPRGDLEHEAQAGLGWTEDAAEAATDEELRALLTGPSHTL